jgi:hypothetical protein
LPLRMPRRTWLSVAGREDVVEKRRGADAAAAADVEGEVDDGDAAEDDDDGVMVRKEDGRVEEERSVEARIGRLVAGEKRCLVIVPTMLGKN